VHLIHHHSRQLPQPPFAQHPVDRHVGLLDAADRHALALVGGGASVWVRVGGCGWVGAGGCRWVRVGACGCGWVGRAGAGGWVERGWQGLRNEGARGGGGAVKLRRSRSSQPQGQRHVSVRPNCKRITLFRLQSPNNHHTPPNKASNPATPSQVRHPKPHLANQGRPLPLPLPLIPLHLPPQPRQQRAQIGRLL